MPLIGPPSKAGPYTVEVSFGGSTDYLSATSLANFNIAQAAPVLAVSNPGGTFDSSTFPTTDSVAGVVPGFDNTPGPTLENTGLTLAYYAGTYTKVSQLDGLTPLSGSPTVAGTYTVEVSFGGSDDYAAGAASPTSPSPGRRRPSASPTPAAPTTSRPSPPRRPSPG